MKIKIRIKINIKIKIRIKYFLIISFKNIYKLIFKWNYNFQISKKCKSNYTNKYYAIKILSEKIGNIDFKEVEIT